TFARWLRPAADCSCLWTAAHARHRYTKRTTTCRRASSDSFNFSSVLFAFDPGDDLIGIEDQSAAGPGPEVRQAHRNELLPYGPGRAADQLGYLAEVERVS